MAKQLIPRVQPNMIKEQPSQFCEILNRVIDKLNGME